MEERAFTKSFLSELSPSPLITTRHTTIMGKLLCAVFVSSLFLATLADDASSSLHSSQLNRQQGQVLGRKAREVGLLGHHYRQEVKHKKQLEVAAMEVKKSADTKAGWADEDAKEGMIYSADYSGVAMHSRSPPAHKHPKP